MSEAGEGAWLAGIGGGAGAWTRGRVAQRLRGEEPFGSSQAPSSARPTMSGIVRSITRSDTTDSRVRSPVPAVVARASLALLRGAALAEEPPRATASSRCAMRPSRGAYDAEVEVRAPRGHRDQVGGRRRRQRASVRGGASRRGWGPPRRRLRLHERQPCGDVGSRPQLAARARGTGELAHARFLDRHRVREGGWMRPRRARGASPRGGRRRIGAASRQPWNLRTPFAATLATHLEGDAVLPGRLRSGTGPGSSATCWRAPPRALHRDPRALRVSTRRTRHPRSTWPAASSWPSSSMARFRALAEGRAAGRGGGRRRRRAPRRSLLRAMASRRLHGAGSRPRLQALSGAHRHGGLRRQLLTRLGVLERLSDARSSSSRVTVRTAARRPPRRPASSARVPERPAPHRATRTAAPARPRPPEGTTFEARRRPGGETQVRWSAFRILGVAPAGGC